MSLSGAVNSAITAAKAALGDLVTTATLRLITSETYNTGTGLYDYVTEDTPVETAPDKFSYNEMGDADYETTDIKFIVFNPNNDLNITTKHTMVINGVEYGIRRSNPTYVGAFIPVWTVILKK